MNSKIGSFIRRCWSCFSNNSTIDIDARLKTTSKESMNQASGTLISGEWLHQRDIQRETINCNRPENESSSFRDAPTVANSLTCSDDTIEWVGVNLPITLDQCNKRSQPEKPSIECAKISLSASLTMLTLKQTTDLNAVILDVINGDCEVLNILLSKSIINNPWVNSKLYQALIMAIYDSYNDTVTAISTSLLNYGVDLKQGLAVNLASKNLLTAIVELLLEQGTDINSCSSEFPLVTAVKGKNIECTKLLLEHEADVNCSNSIKNCGMALYWSVINDDPNHTELLLSHGANVHALNRADDSNLLFYAIKLKNTQCAELLLTYGIDVNNALGTSKFYNPLYQAICNNSSEHVKLLLAHNAYLHTDDDYNPLNKAILMKNVGIAAILVSHASKVNSDMEDQIDNFYSYRSKIKSAAFTDVNDTTVAKSSADLNSTDELVCADSPLMLDQHNVRSQSEECIVVEYNKISLTVFKTVSTLEQSIHLDEMISAVTSGDCEKFDRLLLSRIMINNPQVNRKLYESLMIAIGHSKDDTAMSILKSLINYGIDLSHGRAVDYAIEKSLNKTVRRLLQEGADINSPFSNYPLLTAVNNNNIECIELLLSFGANVRSNKDKPLYLAVINDNPECTKLLLSYGSNVKARYYLNNNLLYNAVQLKNVACAKLLLDYGIDVNNDFGNNPLHYAIVNNSMEQVKLLLSYRASFDTSDISELLNHAIKSKRVEIARLLVSYGTKVDVMMEHAYCTLLKNNKIEDPRGTPLNLKALCFHKINASLNFKASENARDQCVNKLTIPEIFKHILIENHFW